MEARTAYLECQNAPFRGVKYCLPSQKSARYWRAMAGRPRRTYF
jgi:hypothetical protein